VASEIWERLSEIHEGCLFILVQINNRTIQLFTRRSNYLLTVKQKLQQDSGTRLHMLYEDGSSSTENQCVAASICTFNKTERQASATSVYIGTTSYAVRMEFR
jgi:hypothetical protein